jgi:hypothetical protein
VTFQTTDQSTAAEHIKPIRWLIGFVLLGAAGLELFRLFWVWLLSPPETSGPLDQRSLEAASQFTELPLLALPLLAVLITTMIAPVVPQAKQITLIALVEYGVMILGALVTTVVGLGVLLEYSAWILINLLLDRLVMLTLLGLAGFVVLRIYLGAYLKTAPATRFGGGYPAQPYPGYPQQGYPQPAAAAAQQAAQQAQFAQQTQYSPQAQHAQQAQYPAQYGQQSQFSQAAQPGYGYGQQQTSQYEAVQSPGYQPAQPSDVPASPAPESGSGPTFPTSEAPATGHSGSAQPAPEPDEAQQYDADPTRRTTGWPPTPGASGSQWPPAPGAGTGQQSEDSGQTQVFRPDQYRGNAPG